MLPPTPSSTPCQGGPRQFDKRYSAGRTEGGSWTMRTRSAFVSVDRIAMRDRVAESVWRVCARKANGAGVRGGHHVCSRVSGSVCGWKSKGSTASSGKSAGSKAGGATAGCLRSGSTGTPEPEPEPEPEPVGGKTGAVLVLRKLRSGSGCQRCQRCLD